MTLIWSEKRVIASKARRIAAATATRINNPTGAIFKITDCKLYVTVVTLSAGNDNKLLGQLRAGFKRTIKWNKYRSEMSN